MEDSDVVQPSSLSQNVPPKHNKKVGSTHNLTEVNNMQPSTSTSTNNKRMCQHKFQILFDKGKKPVLTSQDDDDTMFLLSFCSYMNTMSINQKLEFKLGMLQLIKRSTIINPPSPVSDSSLRRSNYHSGGV